MGFPVVHFEMMSRDPAGVSDFYAGLFGWKVKHMPELNYRTVDTGSKLGINGGILRPEREGPWPGNMVLYIAVDDLAAYRRKVVAAGGLLTPRKIAIRTLLRVVDGFPWILPYLVGTVVAGTSSKHQRIGDMAAKTLVVRA